MKVKARLRRFWRHNRHFMGMWMFLWQIFVAMLPPYSFDHTWMNILLGLVWTVVWIREREIETLRRRFTIRERQFDKNWYSLLERQTDNICKLEEANLDAMKEQTVHAKRCFCKVCDYKKDKCNTDWRCDAYAIFCEALQEG